MENALNRCRRRFAKLAREKRGSITSIVQGKPRITYIFPFISVIISLCIFSWFDLFQTDAKSARYMLSALVQGEATVIAIVITLSLVAVQLMASSYSPRVTEVFRKKPDLWALMSLYIISIVFSVAVLKLIEENPKDNSEIYICISFFFGIVCFSAIIPYTYNMFIMLKPSTLIEKLSSEINKDGVLEGNPIQSVIDIVQNSLIKYDYEATEDGLRVIKCRICNIFGEEELMQDESAKISKKVFPSLFKVGELALIRKNEDSAMKVIESIAEVGEVIIESELEMAAHSAIESLEKLGKAAVEKELEMAAHSVVESLGEIGEAAVEKELEMAAHWAAESLKKIGMAEVKKELKMAARFAVTSLGDVGKAAAERKLEMAAHWAAESLEVIGKAAVGKAVVNEELEIVAQSAVESLEIIEKAEIERNLEQIAEWATESLGEIGKVAAKKELEIVAQSAVESLEIIEKVAVKKDFKKIKRQATEYLEDIKEIMTLGD